MGYSLDSSCPIQNVNSFVIILFFSFLFQVIKKRYENRIRCLQIFYYLLATRVLGHYIITKDFILIHRKMHYLAPNTLYSIRKMLHVGLLVSYKKEDQEHRKLFFLSFSKRLIVTPPLIIFLLFFLIILNKKIKTTDPRVYSFFIFLDRLKSLLINVE